MQPIPFDLAVRRGGLERAAEGVADLVIVGAGITGAGVAREAALRGLTTVILDKGDFAGGTSSRSSKLIHGGLRYLAQGDVALVREAARERAVLRRLAPHLARPLAMMVPTASLAGRLKMQAGVWTFEKLAGDKIEEKHEVLDRSDTLAAEPRLRSDRLAGSVVFQEFLTDDARLVLENVQSAAALGAVAASYAEVVGLESDPAGLRVHVADRLGGGALVVRARAVVNAAGPWFDRIRGMADAAAAPMLQLTRGIHLVVARERLPVEHSVVLKSADGRSTFVVPRGDEVYVGTTDTHYDGAAEEPGIAADDVDYLLASVAATFEDAPGRADVIGTWSGVRPLLRQDGKSPSEISRRDEILVGPGPIVGIVGGKLTTYRRMSERVCAEVFRLLGRGADPSIDSAEGALAGGSRDDQESARAATRPLGDAALDARLWATYGLAARAIVEKIHEHPALAQPLAGLAALTYAEVEHAVHHEMVTGVDDLLRRRSRLALFRTESAIAAAKEAARTLGGLLGWSEGEAAGQAEEASRVWSADLGAVRSGR